MKSTLLKKLFFALAITAIFSLSSCKDNEVREGEIVERDEFEAEDIGTTATETASDTTSRAEEDSLIETPSP